MKHWTHKTALAAALATLTAIPAAATETIRAVVIDGYPARALWVPEFTNFFIPEVDRLLAETGNYQMEWQESYGGSIVKPKGVLEGVALGLGDIGPEAGLPVTMCTAPPASSTMVGVIDESGRLPGPTAFASPPTRP